MVTARARRVARLEGAAGEPESIPLDALDRGSRDPSTVAERYRPACSEWRSRIASWVAEPTAPDAEVQRWMPPTWRPLDAAELARARAIAEGAR